MSLRPRETSAARRVPMWLLAVLVVSLLLNGLIVGAVASRWHRGPPHPPALGTASNAQLFGFAVVLPKERWREVQKSVEHDRLAVRELRQAVHAARDDARKILLAEPFDPKSYAAAQKKLFDSEQVMRLRALDMVQSIAAQLTPAERAAFVRWEEEDRSRRQAFWRNLRGEEGRRRTGQGED